MDYETADRLRKLNNSFYREYHESFSESRQAPWPGWDRVAEHIDAGTERCSVLDVACGNLRFEKFLKGKLARIAFDFECVDSCKELVCPAEGVNFVERDVLELLLNVSQSAEEVFDGPFDVAVTFGFMHHVPGSDNRLRLLESMLSAVKPLGLIAVSFWCFTRNERMAETAWLSTQEALGRLDIALDEQDYLLGWNADARACRYCHSFTDAEIDGMVESLGSVASLVERFDSDGRTGNLNTYVVLRKDADG